jgi:hypothetical protein
LTARWELYLRQLAKLSRVLRFTIADGKIVQAEIIADPARLREVGLAVL